MKTLSSRVAHLSLFLALGTTSVLGFGQAAANAGLASAPPGVPRLVKFSSQLKDASGSPLTDTVGVMFAVYSERTGGVPLWQEIQNVQFAQGRYTVYLGGGTSTGIPAELFAASEARWLGVRAQLPGEEEQPRVLLTSVPYALKALDADTLGGLPPSAYMRTGVTSPNPATMQISNVTSSANVVSTSGGSSPRRGGTSSEENGQISINDSTFTRYSFVTRWTSPPLCTLTPTSDPHALGGYWVTSSTAAMTVNVHYEGRITFNFRCLGTGSF